VWNDCGKEESGIQGWCWVLELEGTTWAKMAALYETEQSYRVRDSGHCNRRLKVLWYLKLWLHWLACSILFHLSEWNHKDLRDDEVFS